MPRNHAVLKITACITRLIWLWIANSTALWHLHFHISPPEICSNAAGAGEFAALFSADIVPKRGAVDTAKGRGSEKMAPSPAAVYAAELELEKAGAVLGYPEQEGFAEVLRGLDSGRKTLAGVWWSIFLRSPPWQKRRFRS